MKPYLIDTHCHLHFKAYDEDRDDVLLRMREKNIWGITVGTNAVTSKEGIDFASKHDDIYCSVGYHPEHLSSDYVDDAESADYEAFDIDRIIKLATSSEQVVAIGETGLDFYRIDKSRDRDQAIQDQEQAFIEHIHVAKNLQLPLVIHCRDAFRRLAEILQAEADRGYDPKGVIHCFTGTWEDAKPLLDLGMYLSFTGIITFPSKQSEDPEHSIHRVIERMPLDRLLVETDAPWLTPVPHRGKKNMPTFVEFIAKKIGEIRGLETEEIAKKTTTSAIDLFQLNI